jgi:thiol-disulfide isomerase/thioredoxin
MRGIFTALLLCLSTSVFAVSQGDMAPNFKLKNLASGKAETLKEYRGKVVYLDFWASWCGPCRQSLPLLNDLRKELKHKGFEVIAVNLDENVSDAKDFLKQFPVQYPILLDSKGTVPANYNLPGMPTSYLIDRKGRVQKVHIGFKETDMNDIRKSVTSLLRQK